MKLRLLDWLACPGCGAMLAIASGAVVHGELREGTLACKGCASHYPVERGIPRLLPAELAAEAAATAARFGYEWTQFAEIRPEYEEQFRGWIAPVEPESFKGRLVVDGGCGKGRHLRLASAFGAREVIGLDLGPAVEVAARNTADLDNVHVIQADLTRPPLRAGSMEVAYSIGVLHHLREPAAGFRALAALLAPDGLFVAWTYAREGNGWLLAVIDPARRITRRLPLPLVRSLAWILTVPLWAAIRLLYGPARSRSWLRRLLPYQSYLSDLASFPFREIHSIVFDQLLAPVAHYMSRDEVEGCLAAADLAFGGLRWHHNNSWAASGRRKNDVLKLEQTLMPKIGAAHHSTDGEDVVMPRPSAVVSASEQAMSIKYNTMVYEMTRAGQKVIVMSLGEAFFDIPLFPMDDLPHPAVYHYSHSRGIPELREKLAGHFKKAYDVPIDPESEILITAGSKAAIHMALMSILDPGDEVLIHEPTWVSYPEQIKLCYGKLVRIPLGAAIRDYEKYVTRKMKAIVVNTPHNPSGYVWSESDLGYVLDLAKKHNLWVLSDEAYSEFVTTGTFVSIGALDREKRHSIIFNSISKNYGISGWRMGYVIANKVLTDQILKVNQHLITCPPTILEYYISKHFDRILDITRPQIRAVVEQRAQLSRYMKEIGLDHMPGTATFYFFVSIAPSKLGSEEFATRLLQNDLVSTVPGLGYGNSCDKYIRVSVGTMSLDDNMHGLRKIKELIEKTS